MRNDPWMKGPVWALGAMSGTSLDGVDAAMLQTDGERILAFGPSAYHPYSDDERAVLRAALGAWPGEPAVAPAARVVEDAHVALLARFEGAELIGFHGQTFAHEPRGRGTHQAGSGDLLAEALERPVVWDFRSADVALGGQGAPLAPFYHFALAKYLKLDAPVAFLNLGGVGNVTWVDPRKNSPESEGALLAFDTGPANAPINDLMQARLGKSHDEGGAWAAKGRVKRVVIERFLKHSFFARMPPKSLDRDAFVDLVREAKKLETAAAAATLTAAAVAAVEEALTHFPAPVAEVLVCGGGRHNPVIMASLAKRLGCRVRAVEDYGLDGDMLEAQAFAYLAVRVARGLPTSCPMTTGVSAAVGGGVLSRPAPTSDTAPSARAEPAPAT